MKLSYLQYPMGYKYYYHFPSNIHEQAINYHIYLQLDHVSINPWLHPCHKASTISVSHTTWFNSLHKQYSSAHSGNQVCSTICHFNIHTNCRFINYSNCRWKCLYKFLFGSNALDMWLMSTQINHILVCFDAFPVFVVVRLSLSVFPSLPCYFFLLKWHGIRHTGFDHIHDSQLHWQ